MRPKSDTVYVIQVIKTIRGEYTSRPIGCKATLEGAQQSMARYVKRHRLDLTNGQEWPAEETTVKVYNMKTEIYNCHTEDRIDIRIYPFNLSEVIS